MPNTRANWKIDSFVLPDATSEHHNLRPYILLYGLRPARYVAILGYSQWRRELPSFLADFAYAARVCLQIHFVETQITIISGREKKRGRQVNVTAYCIRLFFCIRYQIDRDWRFIDSIYARAIVSALKSLWCTNVSSFFFFFWDTWFTRASEMARIYWLVVFSPCKLVRCL